MDTHTPSSSSWPSPQPPSLPARPRPPSPRPLSSPSPPVGLSTPPRAPCIRQPTPFGSHSRTHLCIVTRFEAGFASSANASFRSSPPKVWCKRRGPFACGVGHASRCMVPADCDGELTRPWLLSLRYCVGPQWGARRLLPGALHHFATPSHHDADNNGGRPSHLRHAQRVPWGLARASRHPYAAHLRDPEGRLACHLFK